MIVASELFSNFIPITSCEELEEDPPLLILIYNSLINTIHIGRFLNLDKCPELGLCVNVEFTSHYTKVGANPHAITSYPLEHPVYLYRHADFDSLSSLVDALPKFQYKD